MECIKHSEETKNYMVRYCDCPGQLHANGGDFGAQHVHAIVYESTVRDNTVSIASHTLLVFGLLHATEIVLQIK